MEDEVPCLAELPFFPNLPLRETYGTLLRYKLIFWISRPLHESRSTAAPGQGVAPKNTTRKHRFRWIV